MNPFERARLVVAPTYERTLIIIDMQSCFVENADERLVPTIQNLIRHAKRNVWPIILVELGEPPTIAEISDEILDYPHTEVVTKTGLSGGKEVIDCLRDRKTWPLNLVVCGVWGDQCVAATVAGLFDNSDLVEVDVVSDAVWPSYKPCDKDVGRVECEREVTMEELGATAQQSLRIS